MGPGMIAPILAVLLAVSPCVPARDSHGRIARSSSVRREFQREHPCPSTGKKTGSCHGWIVDHVVALECCGADSVKNMQWQTVADSKAKDRVEGRCGR